MDGTAAAGGKSPLKACLTQSVSLFLLWGVPYFLGKAYFGSLERPDLAIVFVLAALLYAPLCLV